ncbi:hypothetical protein [Vacuolonema iberomarrocanum]|uniref:hypothetical protein n=1 Tax=Vacuolonema iberomarrocanum TaxID=3454632 RepID=UPI003F6DCA71
MENSAMRHIVLLVLLIAPGILGVLVFGYFALIDWEALMRTYSAFETAAQTSTNMSVLFTAEAQQNIHRINLFAEGVWVLLSAIIAAIGIHGMCIPKRNRL